MGAWNKDVDETVLTERRRQSTPWCQHTCVNTLVSTLFLSTLFLPTLLYAQDIRIVDVAYEQHGTTVERLAFRVTVRNLESTAQFAEVDVTLTNVDTEAETTLIPVMTGTVAAGGVLTLVSNYTMAAGTYTVTFPLFDGNGVRHDRVSGKFPLHIGSNADTLHVFPETVHLGTIPQGRFMYPVPLEIRWNFYRFNRLRLDQPFAIRVYTDNAAHYRGAPGAVRQGSPAGLVSDDGRFTVPMKIWTANFGPDVQETGWDPDTMGPPPVDDDTFWRGPLVTDPIHGAREVGAVAWLRIPDLSEMSADPGSWRRLIGQDPYDSRFVADTNITGDFTLPNPITAYLATEAGATAVEGQYSATLVVELWSP